MSAPLPFVYHIGCGMSSDIGEADYRAGAIERLREAGILLEQQFLGGAIYLAGRSVECSLRALIWKHDADIRTGRKSLDTGHDLREMLELVADLGVLRDAEHRDLFAAEVQRIARLWHNNMRYFPTSKIKKHWWRRREIGGKRSLKAAAVTYYESCSSVVKRCERL